MNQQEVYLTASVGIAICPYDAENVIDLIRNADAAMYHSKQNGGNTCAFYVPEMNAAAVETIDAEEQAAARVGTRRAGDPVSVEGGPAQRAGRGRGGAAALAAAGTRRHFSLALHSSGGGNQPDIGYRRMGAESRLCGLPGVAEDRAAARPNRHQSVVAATQTGELHLALPQCVPQARGIAHLLRAGSHRNHLDDRSEAHHRAAERAVRHGPESGHRRFRHGVLVAVGLAAVSRSAP